MGPVVALGSQGEVIGSAIREGQACAGGCSNQRHRPTDFVAIGKTMTDEWLAKAGDAGKAVVDSYGKM